MFYSISLIHFISYARNDDINNTTPIYPICFTQNIIIYQDEHKINGKTADNLLLFCMVIYFGTYGISRT